MSGMVRYLPPTPLRLFYQHNHECSRSGLSSMRCLSLSSGKHAGTALPVFPPPTNVTAAIGLIHTCSKTRRTSKLSHFK